MYDGGIEPGMSYSDALHTYAVSSTNRKHSKHYRTQSRNRKVSTKGEQMFEKGRLLEQQSYTNKPQLRSSVHSEFARTRSLSDSYVLKDSDDSVTLSEEQREKLESLKRQIYDTNTKRKNYRTGHGTKSQIPHSNPQQNRRKTMAASGEKLFPALTVKSLKNHLRSHSETRHQTISLIGGNSTLSNSSSTSKKRDATEKFEGMKLDRDETYLDGESSNHSNSLLKPSSLVSFTDNQQVVKEENSSRFATSTKGERSDSFEPIIVSERLRTQSEPGDVGRRKFSTIQELQKRTRKEANAVKDKVQSFIEKPLPAVPPSSLRLHKRKNSAAATFRHIRAGANANMAVARERKQGVINMHTCPNLNVSANPSWVYHEKARNKHRYIRGPATPIPPADFVFTNASGKESS